MWRYPAAQPPGAFWKFWLWRRASFPPGKPYEGLLVWPRRISRYVQWFLVALLLTWLALWTLHFLWDQRGKLQFLWDWIGRLING